MTIGVMGRCWMPTLILLEMHLETRRALVLLLDNGAFHI